MKMFTDCSGECVLCSEADWCCAGHGDDEYHLASEETIIKRLESGRKYNEDALKTMIGFLHKRGYDCVCGKWVKKSAASSAENLAQNLREYAEWADANQWETPICLGDDLRKAADYIEMMEGRMSDDGK